MSSLPSKPSQKNGLLFKLKAKLLACFGDTTAHGYGRVANADSRPLRWFWILVCAAAVAAFFQQLCGITKQYMSRPLKVRASIGHEVKKHVMFIHKQSDFYFHGDKESVL